MSCQSRIRAHELKQVLSSAAAPCSALLGNGKVLDALRSADLGESEIASALSPLTSLSESISQAMENDLSVSSLGAAIDELNAQSMLSLWKLSSLGALAQLLSPTPSLSLLRLCCSVLEAIASPQSSSSARWLFASNLNEPALREMSLLGGVAVDAFCSLSQRSISSVNTDAENECVAASLSLLQSQLCVLRRAASLFSNHRKAFSAACDAMLEPALRLWGLQEELLSACAAHSHREREKALRAVFAAASDALQCSLFSDSLVHEIVSVPLSLHNDSSNSGGAAEETQRASKKPRVEKDKEKERASGSFASRLYEVVSSHFQRTLQSAATSDSDEEREQALRRVSRGVASLWTSFHAATKERETAGELDDSNNNNNSSNSNNNNNNNNNNNKRGRDETVSVRRRVAHMLHFALALMQHCERSQQHAEALTHTATTQLQAALLSVCVSALRNTAMPNHSSLDKYAAALRGLWQRAVSFSLSPPTDTHIDTHTDTRAGAESCRLLSACFDVIRLVQLVDHRVAVDHTRTALQLLHRSTLAHTHARALCAQFRAALGAEVHVVHERSVTLCGEKNAREHVRRSLLSSSSLSVSVSPSALLALYDCYESKLSLLRDLWMLFARLRSLDTLVRVFLDAERETDREVVRESDALGVEKMLESAALRSLLLQSLVRLPSGQWAKVWNTVLHAPLRRLRERERETETETEEETAASKVTKRVGERVLSLSSCALLSLVFEAQQSVSKSAVKLVRERSQALSALTADEHTTSLCFLLQFLAQSMQCLFRRTHSHTERENCDTMLRAHLRLLRPLLLYVVKTYAADTALLHANASLPAVSVSLFASEEERESESEEEVKTSCVEVFRDSLVSLLSAIHKRESKRDAERESESSSQEDLLGATLALSQLLLNVDAKSSVASSLSVSLSLQKEIETLAELVAQHCRERTRESEAERSLSLLLILLRETYAVRALAVSGGESFVDALRALFAVSVRALLTHRRETHSAEKDRERESLRRLLSCAQVADVLAEWNLLHDNVLRALETERESQSGAAVDLSLACDLLLAQPLHNEAVAQRLTAYALHVLHDFESDRETLPAGETERARAAVLLLRHALQHTVSLSLSSYGEGVLHAHMETNVLTVRLKDIAVRALPVTHRVSEDEEDLSVVCAQCVVLYHHLRLRHCLSTHAQDGKPLQAQLEQLFALDAYNFDHNCSGKKKKNNNSTSTDSAASLWLLRTARVVLQDLLFALSDVSVSNAVREETLSAALRHVEGLQRRSSSLSLRRCHVALWWSAVQQLSSQCVRLPPRLTTALRTTQRALATEFLRISAKSERENNDGDRESEVEDVRACALLFGALGNAVVRELVLRREERCLVVDAEPLQELSLSMRTLLLRAVQCEDHEKEIIAEDDICASHMQRGLALAFFALATAVLGSSHCNLSLDECVSSLDIGSVCDDMSAIAREGERLQCLQRTLVVLCGAVASLAEQLSHRDSPLAVAAAQRPAELVSFFHALFASVSSSCSHALLLVRVASPLRALAVLNTLGSALHTLDVALYQLLLSSRSAAADGEEDEHDWLRETASKIVKEWAKKTPALYLQISETLLLLSHAVARSESENEKGAAQEALVRATKALLLLQNGLAALAIRSHVPHLVSKLQLVSGAVSNCMFLLARLEAVDDSACVSFSRQGLQLVARILTNTANVAELGKHLYLLITVLVQSIAQISALSSSASSNAKKQETDEDEEGEGKKKSASASLSKSFKEIVYPGIFALFEKLNLKQKTQIFKLLDATTRVVMTDIHEEFMRNHKFQGN